MKHRVPTQILQSTAPDVAVAVSEIKQQISINNIEGIIFFCSSHFNLEDLSTELNNTFICDVIGCTTAGEITDKYGNNSIVALVLSSDSFAVHSALIDDVKSFNLSQAMKISNEIESNLAFNQHFASDKMFGFLLTDGLSLQEEKITSLIYQVMGEVNIIGGSAGDDLELNQTFVCINKKFHSNAAAIIMLEVKDDFDVFRMQHFVPTNKELIITEVDFENRIVKEINGEPAAIAYANINGLKVNELSNLDFAMFPLMLNIADDWYIRSILNVNPDHSLQFYCALDNGLPLSIGRGIDIVKRLQDEVEKIENQFDEIYFTLGCDCILRRLEIINKGDTKKIENLLTRINFIGFSGYGEQFNGIHFNQTMVGTVVGRKSEVGSSSDE